jgi:hypothetical protein
MIRVLILLMVLPLSIVRAHHGVATLGVAGLEGPGAPIETSSSANLPRGGVLAYVKLDFAKFEKLTTERDDEGDFNAFWMYGLGYGATSYLSIYLLTPFYSKTTEDNSFNSSGFADISALAVLGFRLSDRFGLVPENESLDDLEDPHFTLYGGLTLPTGDADLKDADGNIDPGMSLGFGKPSFTGGVTATKQIGSRWTFVLDSSMIGFNEYEYDDGCKVRFGTEIRINSAATTRLLTDASRKLRFDVNLESNYLSLGRDKVDGVGELATGGKMVYAVGGFRLYVKSTSLGVGIKLPVWTDLNEEPRQQGAEGKENYRMILSFSTLL